MCACKGNQFTGLMFTVKPVNEAFKKGLGAFLKHQIDTGKNIINCIKNN